jgi:amidohydrolase
MNINFLDLAKDNFEYCKSIRRAIHQNPELSFNEIETSKLIASELTNLGIKNFFALKSSIEEPENNIGVIGVLGVGERTVALRADIDALPIAESTSLEFSSRNQGVMHACGHDMHTAMLLTAAKILKENEKEINGRILLIFQPAEEMLPGGAKLILDSKILDEHKPEAFFGQHINPELQSGKIVTKSGPLMASTDEIHLTIHGKSTHAAQPHLGADPILASANIIQSLQNLLTKFKNPLEPAVISVTAINSGNTTNIIPDSAKMMGTIRTYNQELRELLKEKINSNIIDIAKQYDCTVENNILEGYPPLINNTETTELVQDVTKQILGENSYEIAEPKMWAEDFAYYSQIAPSTFWFLGVKNEDKPIFPLHNPNLNPDENALIQGTAIMSAIGIEYLNRI